MRFKARCPWCGEDAYFQQVEPVKFPSPEMMLERRIEELEWLVEALDLKVHRVVHAGEWAQKHAGPAIRVAWKRRENSNYELRYTIEAARLAAGVK